MNLWNSVSTRDLKMTYFGEGDNIFLTGLAFLVLRVVLAAAGLLAFLTWVVTFLSGLLARRETTDFDLFNVQINNPENCDKNFTSTYAAVNQLFKNIAHFNLDIICSYNFQFSACFFFNLILSPYFKLLPNKLPPYRFNAHFYHLIGQIHNASNVRQMVHFQLCRTDIFDVQMTQSHISPIIRAKVLNVSLF